MKDLWAPTLFDDHSDTARPTVNVDALAAATEHRLDDHSSITVVRGLVTGHWRLFQELSASPDWQQRRRWMYNQHVDEPRLTMEHRSFEDAPRLLAEIADALSRYCGVPYDGIWMNWYRNHDDSTSWHADRPANVADTAVVPVVSLGAARRFLIRPVGGGSSTAFTPQGGDVLIMRGRCQREWQHCVPKQRAQAAGRISLNYTSSTQASS